MTTHGKKSHYWPVYDGSNPYRPDAVLLPSHAKGIYLPITRQYDLLQLAHRFDQFQRNVRAINTKRFMDLFGAIAVSLDSYRPVTIIRSPRITTKTVVFSNLAGEVVGYLLAIHWIEGDPFEDEGDDPRESSKAAIANLKRKQQRCPAHLIEKLCHDVSTKCMYLSHLCMHRPF